MAEIQQGQIYRKRKYNFVSVSNEVMKNAELSLKAKGLYALIQCFLDIPNFVLYKDHLIKMSNDGKASFNTAWQELKDHGYLIQYKIQTQKGFIYSYELVESVEK